jgi:HEAT repeat protein
MLSGICLALAAPAPAQPSPSPDSTLTPAAALQQERLARFRGFITNTNDSDATRIAQAETLLSTEGEPAIELVVSLFDTGDDPSTKIVLCQALQNLARKPEAPDPRLRDALLRQLDSTNAAVATRASAALAMFPLDSVLPTLRAIAADGQKPLPVRMAALAALQPNTHRREVVAALIQLLDANSPELVSRVMAALQRSARKDLGSDVAAWKAWWKSQEALTDTQWLTAQLARDSELLQEQDRRFQAFKEESTQRYAQLATRLGQTLAAMYRSTPPVEKDSLLQSWLADSFIEFRRSAVALIAEQISEGSLPSAALREGLHLRYADESPEIRRLAFEIIAALNEPTDAPAILARLELEKDDRVREAILRALGKLRNPEALPALKAELEREGASDGCVIAAADGLGMLAGRGRADAGAAAGLVEPLRSRFARAAQGPVEVRVALLGAMAAIGSPSFRAEFASNLGSENPELLVAALQGIAVVGDGAQLDRLMDLVNHSDPRVRQRALAALGALGTEQQLSTVIARLSEGAEAVEGPRNAAWQAYKQICGRLPLSSQLAAVDRLADQPLLATDYLQDLYDGLVAQQPPAPQVSEVRERLAQRYVALNRNAEALPLWRQVFTDAGSSAARPDVCMNLLRCGLAAGNHDAIVEALRALSAANDGSRTEAEDAVLAHFAQLRTAGKTTDAQALASPLRDSEVVQAYPRLREQLALLSSANDETPGKPSPIKAPPS